MLKQNNTAGENILAVILAQVVKNKMLLFNIFICLFLRKAVSYGSQNFNNFVQRME